MSKLTRKECRKAVSECKKATNYLGKLINNLDKTDKPEANFYRSRKVVISSNCYQVKNRCKKMGR